MKTFFFQLFLFFAWVIPGFVLLAYNIDNAWTNAVSGWFVFIGIVSVIVGKHVPIKRRLLIVSIRTFLCVGVTVLLGWLLDDSLSFLWAMFYCAISWFFILADYLDERFYRRYRLVSVTAELPGEFKP